MSEWYQLETDQVIEKLQTDAQNGLTDSEAKKRIEQYGPNELIEKGAKSPWLILWDQMKELKDEADLLAAKSGQLVFIQRRDVLAIDEDTPSRRRIESRNQPQ